MKLGHVLMRFSLDRPEGVPTCLANGVLRMNKREKRKKRNEEIIAEVTKWEQRLRSKPSAAVRLQLAMSYLNFCMHEVAMRAANQSIKHLDASGNADQQNPARWQALEALAVSAFNIRNEPLMRDSLEQRANGVEAAARAKNNTLGFVNAAQLWAQLVVNLLVMGVPFSDVQVYYVKNQSGIIFPIYCQTPIIINSKSASMNS